MNTFKICKVLSVSDNRDTDTIKVRFEPEDDKFGSLDQIPECFPLLPKQFFVKPKVGEAVLVFTDNPENAFSHRFYIGPLISQPNKIGDDQFDTAVSFADGMTLDPDIAPSTDPETEGTQPTDDSVSIRGKGDCDIQVNEDDLILRCGVKISNNGNEQDKKWWKRKFTSKKSVFNKQNPAYFKLKYYRNVNDYASTATLVADKINLITHNIGRFNLTDRQDLITDSVMSQIINEAHKLPYGDVLIEFLEKFVAAFTNHVHPYPGMPPCPDDKVISVTTYPLKDILCENICIE